MQDAAAIVRQVDHIAKVGVFVNSSAAVVREIADVCQLDFVQLHGDESPDYCQSLKLPVIKAVRVGDDFTVDFLANYGVDWFLFDSYVPGKVGGTGKTFDWQQTAKLLKQLQTPVMIAGGLTSENVGTAISCLRPQGVDVSGGVETDGCKDLAKIRCFLQAVHQSK